MCNFDLIKLNINLNNCKLQLPTYHEVNKIVQKKGYISVSFKTIKYIQNNQIDYLYTFELQIIYLKRYSKILNLI